MMLYAESPGGLASQQFGYDQLYNSANENNASRFDAAQARAVEYTLRQRAADADAQRFADQVTSRGQDRQDQYSFAAQQGALNRAAYSTSKSDAAAIAADNHQEAVYNEATKLAANGQLTGDALETYRKILTPERFTRLTAVVSGTNKLITAAQTEADAPQNQAATEGATLARAGNLYNRAATATAAIEAKPTSAAHWWNPRWSANIQPDNIIQPTEHAKALMATLKRTLAPQITPAAIAAKDSTLQVNPVTGNLEARYQTTPSFRPPVIQPSNPAPDFSQAAPIVGPQPTRAAPIPGLTRPTRAQLQYYVSRYGRLGAIDMMKKDRFDLSAYAD